MTNLYALVVPDEGLYYSRRLGVLVKQARERDIFTGKALDEIDVQKLEEELQSAMLQRQALHDNPRNWVRKYLTADKYVERSKPYVYLCEGDGYECYLTLAAAVEVYREAAQELARYGQEHSATLHLANCRDEIAEYPDWVLTLSKRGVVQRTKA